METHDYILIAVTLFGLVGTVITALIGTGGAIAYFKLHAENKKLLAEVGSIDAQTDKTAAEGWVLLLRAQGDEVKELRREVEELRTGKDWAVTESDNLRGRVRKLELEVIPALEAEIVNLREQIVLLGGKPKTGPLKVAKEN